MGSTCSGINPLEVYIKSSYPPYSYAPRPSLTIAKRIEMGMHCRRRYISQGLTPFFHAREISQLATLSPTKHFFLVLSIAQLSRA